ncbi:hypothetical protein ABER75_11145 [Niallia taxi]|uniref:hypothetical protein n=1 Tax=Niallia taxi TaxID=2499688 RepID=UPI003D2E603A
MLQTLGLVKENHIKKIVMNEEITEQIIDGSTKQITETMRLIVQNTNYNELYQFFCEDDSKENEKSRIKYFEVDKFPDGVFMVFRDDNSVDCFICELKKTPTNKLKQLKEQLFSGYIHSKSILSILLENFADYQINYHYHVYLINDNSLILEYNQKNPKKIIPGKAITPTSDYELWKVNKAVYKKDNYVFEMNLQKITMESENNLDYSARLCF